MKRAEVLVIGGGIVGCAIAYSLTQLGVRPLLVERAGVASGTSGACMGHLMMISEPLPMFGLSTRSVALWKQFHDDFGGFEMRRCGCLWLGEEGEDWELLEGVQKKTQELGGAGEIIDSSALLAMEPGLAPDLVGAFLYPEDAVIFPMEATGALLRAALDGGAEVWHHTSVDGLEVDGSGAVVAVQTSKGVVECGRVVNATGAILPMVHNQLGGTPDLPIFPRRGDLAITMPQDLPVQTQIIEVAYLRSATGKVADPEDEEPDPGAYAMNVQPQSNGTLLVGSTRQFAGYDRVVNQELLAASLRRATRFVPRLADLQLVRSWAGLRPYTRDKMPLIGPDPAVDGLYVAGGHEGLGITLAMATGEMIAQQITGRESTVPSAPFAPGRYLELVHG